MAKDAKVTINTPDKAPAVQPNAEQVTDSTGRVLTLKRPSVLTQYRIVEVVGAEAAKNEVYMGMVSPLLWVKDIDGDPVRFPATKRELEALIQRLGEEGIEAVMAYFTRKESQDQDEGDALKN